MQYLRLAVFLFSCLMLLALVGGVLLIRAERFPRRLVNLCLAGVCAVTAFLNLLVGLQWTALPWALCVPLWLVAAMRYS